MIFHPVDYIQKYPDRLYQAGICLVFFTIRQPAAADTLLGPALPFKMGEQAIDNGAFLAGKKSCQLALYKARIQGNETQQLCGLLPIYIGSGLHVGITSFCS